MTRPKARSEVRALDIEGAVEFRPPVFRDDRGLFCSPFREEAFEFALKRPLFPVRDVSHNRSATGVLRGVHYTATPPGRAKYVYCPHGRVRDFLVDLRLGSPTFGTVSTSDLDGDNSCALYVPPGVGHGFVALEDDSVIVYLMSAGYVPKDELAIYPLDPALQLAAPDPNTQLSDRDRSAPTLAEARSRGILPVYRTCLEVEKGLWA